MPCRSFISKCFLVILLLDVFVLFSQEDKGRMLRLKLYTVSEKNSKPISLVSLEIFMKGKMIGSAMTDLDGQVVVKVCSTRLLDDNIQFQTTHVGYKQLKYSFKISSDSLLTLSMIRDKKMSKEKVDKYIATYFKECGTDEADQAWYSNHKYRHCDGRVLTYREISEKHWGLNEWERLEE